MGKTATLNIRVNPDVKENAESVLAQLGIPMATAIDAPNVTMDAKYKTIYDLKGNRLNHVTKGVNIVNGKKVLLK